MADDSIFPFYWEDLPDPGKEGCFTAQLTRNAFIHFLDKHIRNEYEPWDEWFPPELIRACRAATSFADLEPWVPGEVSRHCEQAARASLLRPLVLQYRSFRPEVQRMKRTIDVMQLVLPCGALLVIHRNKKHARVRTCYFPVSARKTKASTRWKRVISRLAPRHCIRTTDERHLTPPQSDTTLEFARENRPKERRLNIRFVEPENWGFETIDPHKPPIWSGRFQAWPAATESATVPEPRPRKPRPRLRPRFIVESEVS